MAKLKPGAPVEVEFPTGWRGGFKFGSRCAALDRPYRVNVVDDSGRDWLELAPECVRAAA